MKRIWILIVLCAVAGLMAQTIEYQVIKPDTLYVGTPMQLLVTISAAPGDSIFTPRPETMDIFVPVDVQHAEQLDGDEQRTQFLYTFQPFDVGDFTFPELVFTVSHQGQHTELTTQPFAVAIRSALPDSTQTIQDIVPPVAVNLGWMDVLLPHLLIAAIIAAVILIRRGLRKKEQPIAHEIITETRPAWVIALEQLHALQEQKLLLNGAFLEYHFQLSHILRFFLGRNYRFNAVEMTTSEIKDVLPITDVQQRREIIEKLRWFDMVKFAKYTPTMAASEEAAAWLEALLQRYGTQASTPQEEPQEVQDA
jgi:hypothetical protein